MLELIEQLEKVKVKDNIFTVYDSDSLTVTELLCEFFSKLKECINNTNTLTDIIDYLTSEGMSLEVINKIEEMVNDGTLIDLIGEDLLKDINKEITQLKEQLENIQLIEGPAGPQGQQGEQGPAGPIGPAGRDGRDGIDFDINKQYSELNTNAKDLIGAINEINTKECESNTIDIESIIKSTEFNDLQTDSKLLIGAINEINAKSNTTDSELDIEQVEQFILTNDFNTLNTKKKKIIDGINECYEIIINTNNNLLSIVPHEELNTTDKTIIGAINEINNKEVSGGSVDFDITTEYESLTTTAKDLIGAINEVNAKECDVNISVEDIEYTNRVDENLSNVKQALDDLISFKNEHRESVIELLNKLMEV